MSEFTSKWNDVLQQLKDEKRKRNGRIRDVANKKPTKQTARKPFVRPRYEDYIKSAAWNRKREKAFKQLGRKCAICGSAYHLRVHHLSYKNLGREQISDLQIQCEDCHANTHEGKPAWNCDSLTAEFRSIIDE